MGRTFCIVGVGLGRSILKEYAKRFYKSQTWQKCREQIWQRDKGLCQECLKKGLIKAGDTVHHIIPITPMNIDDASITLNPDNLETVCRDCHALIHSGRERPRYKVDELGRVIIEE